MLDRWIAACGELDWADARPRIRVLHGGDAPAPASRPSGATLVEIVADSNAYRGPAGVVRDGMIDLDGDADFLVLESARHLGAIDPARGALADLIRHHRDEGADVTIGRDLSGAPAGVLVVSRWTLDQIPAQGFVDMKEQWLCRLVAGGARVVVRDLRLRTHAIRTRLDLLRIAETGARPGSEALPAAAGSSGEAWTARERLRRRIEGGWSVSSSARVSDSALVARSIVMERAVVGDGAVVSSCVLLPGAAVPSGAIVMDQVVRPGVSIGPSLAAFRSVGSVA